MNLKHYDGKRICVAVSGGADSVALLHFLRTEQSYYGYILSAVHCEHGIRGKASIKDKEFVEKLCRDWSIPLNVFSINCLLKQRQEKESLETVARNFRKECFEKLIREDKADYIATAHHLGDETETVLLHLARGSALSGSRGMEEESGYLLRPFLRKSKAEILSYIKEHKLAFRTDKTNFQTDATRNKLRLKALPVLRKIFPFFDRNIAKFSCLAAQDDKYLYKLSDKLISYDDKKITVAFEKEKPLFFRAVVTALKKLGVEKDYTLAHIESVYDLQDKERGKVVCLLQGVRAEKTEKGIIVYQAEQEQTQETLQEKPFTLSGFDGDRYEVSFSSTVPESGGQGLKLLCFDLDKLPQDAVFRARKEGDFIKTFSGNGKTLKKLFNEKKIDTKDRYVLPLIASKNTSEVYIVCGVEIAQQIKITETTQNAVYIITKEKE